MNLYHVCCQSLFRGHVTYLRAFSAKVSAKDALNLISAKDALQDVTNEETTQQMHTSIQTKIKKAATPSDLLGMISDPAFGPTHACSTLKYLGDFVKNNKIDPNDLVINKFYLENCRKVKSNLEKTPAFSVLLALQGLYKIGQSSQRDMINLLQNNLVQTSRLMNMRPLVALFLLQQANVKTSSDKKLLRTVAVNIQRRWVEVTHNDDIIAILSHNVEHFDKKFLDQLEDVLLDKVPTMTTTQMMSTLTALGKLRHRHLPLLRALSHHLSSADTELTLNKISSALFTCCVLTFADYSFIEKVGKELIREIPQTQSNAQITSLNTSIGILKWKNADVLDSIEQWIIKNGDKLTKKDATAYIMAVAAVNHTPNQAALPVIERALCVGSEERLNHGWLVDVVWAYTVLNQSTTLLQTLLDTDISVKALSTGRRLKLQQIVQCAQVQGLKIPYMLEESAIKQDDVPRSKDSLLLSEMSLKALKTFVPAPKYLREKITLPNGIYIDGEFAVEGGGNHKPIPLDVWYKEGQTTPNLPDGCSRIAVCVWDHKCTVLHSDDLAGHSSLTSHLLTQLGYHVLHLTHAELFREDKEVKKVQFLQRKLHNLLQPS